MMAGFQALASVTLPFLFFLVPGIAIAPYCAGSGIEKIVRVILCSLATLTLLLLAGAGVGLPNYLVLIVLLAVTAAMLVRNRRYARPATIWTIGLHGVVVLLLTLALAAPYFIFHDGLPSGDSQKAIFWAQFINSTHQLPSYEEAVATLNRDPVDFYTPGLHALTAAVMRVSAYPLMAVGFFSLLAVIGVLYLGAAFLTQLFEARDHAALTVWFGVVLLGNIRFLRYVREPGYHYQNLLGELFLFGLLFLLLSLLRKWRWLDVVLACLVALALLLTHQFSVFLAAFIAIPYALAILARYAGMHLTRRNPAAWKISLGAAAAVVLGFFSLAYATGLYTKLPHLFTLQPHLTDLVPSLRDYHTLVGSLWLSLGLGGLLMLVYDAKHTSSRTPSLAFVTSALIIFMLSQAPRFGLDIPPVRALFYSAVPLAIAASYLLLRLWRAARGHSWQMYVARSFLVVMVGLTVAAALWHALPPAHAVRTNSTLLAEYATLQDYLAAQPGGAVLIDDYNRRSTTWLLLSGHPTYSRLATDVSRQMDEARQSSLREELYLKQLDYEKIYSLGSLPESAALLEKHGITWLAGIAGSSAEAFAYNPHLVPRVVARDVTLYEVLPAVHASRASELSPWLLRASTLVNDIGDAEDTFAHLPASIRSPRVSEPIIRNGATVRVTTSPIIPLHFNASDYVQVLWNQKQAPHPDIALEFFLKGPALPGTLSLSTPSGKIVPLIAHTPVRLEPSDIPYDAQGDITLIILNPTEAPIAIDVIALGLARVP